MGAWGSSLYANDTTSDVRDTYIGFLEEQLSNQEAYDKILTMYSEYLGDPDEEPLFWFALADTQWKVGRLTPEAKTKALKWISNNGGMALWEESKSGGAGWKKTLDKLRVKLETEQPKEKKIRKPEKINQNLWNIGDVYAYQFHTEESTKYGVCDKYMILQKIDEEKYLSGKLIMRVHVFDKLFDDIPILESIRKVRLLPLDFPTSTRNLRMNIWLGLEKEKEYPIEYLTYLGNMPIPENVVRKPSFSSDACWFNIEGWSRYFQLWNGVDYETVEEGTFRYTHQE